MAYRLKAPASQLQAHGKHRLAPCGGMKQEHLPGEAEAMAISFPAAEMAAKHRVELATREHARETSLVAHAGQTLKRGYERVCSAIFDGDGDCMRF